MRRKNFTLFRLETAVLLIVISGLLFSCAAEEMEKIEPPPLFRGAILVHLPFAALPADSAGGSYMWIPIPEMGFSFCPTVQFPAKNGWWEFPIHILTFCPFLEKYGAIGDISIGAGFQVPPLYRMGVAYRFIEGRFYPLKGQFYAHIIEADIALPVKGFSGAGAKVDWIFSTNLDISAPYTVEDESYDHYEGSAFAIAPYWKFKLKYGQLTLAYRIVLSSNIVGVSTGKQTTYKLKTRSISALEINYTYP